MNETFELKIELRRARYSVMKNALEGLLGDLAILAGEKMGPSDCTMQDVVGTAKTNAMVLALQLESAYRGNMESFITFPSAAEILEKDGE